MLPRETPTSVFGDQLSTGRTDRVTRILQPPHPKAAPSTGKQRTWLLETELLVSAKVPWAKVAAPGRDPRKAEKHQQGLSRKNGLTSSAHPSSFTAWGRIPPSANTVPLPHSHSHTQAHSPYAAYKQPSQFAKVYPTPSLGRNRPCMQPSHRHPQAFTDAQAQEGEHRRGHLCVCNISCATPPYIWGTPPRATATLAWRPAE